MYPVILVLVAAIVLAPGPGQPAHATEPDGPLVLRWAWQDTEGESGESPGGTLRLTVRTRAPVEEARLLATVPAAVDAAVLSPGWAEAARWSPDADGARSLRLDLGRLDPARPLAIEFRLVARPGEGGITAFTVQGDRVDGHPQRGATGVAVGRPGGAGVLRDGAREFPAARPSPEAR